MKILSNNSALTCMQNTTAKLAIILAVVTLQIIRYENRNSEIFFIWDRNTVLGYAIIHVYMWRAVLVFGTYRLVQNQTLMLYAFQGNVCGLSQIRTQRDNCQNDFVTSRQRRLWHNNCCSAATIPFWFSKPITGSCFVRNVVLPPKENTHYLSLQSITILIRTRS